METTEIFESIRQYLLKDRYNYYPIKDEDGRIALQDALSMDICNSIPENTNRPYYKIESIDQAKEIMKSLLLKFIRKVDEVSFNRIFQNNVESKSLNPHGELFFSVYRELSKN
jgi:hypothetical protein